VHFVAQTATMNEECGAKVAKIATWLKDHPTVSVRLAGYVDQAEQGRVSATLGERRAEVVRQALIAAGVESTRIETRTDQNWMRCEDSAAETCQRWNRRVEVMPAGAL